MTHRLLLFLLAFLTLPLFSAGNVRSQEPAQDALTAADEERWDDARQLAERAENTALTKLVGWLYLLDAESGAGFAEISGFIVQNPNWPEQKKLRVRAEQSLRFSAIADRDIIAWFDTKEPITGIGKWVLAEALLRQGPVDEARIDGLIRDAWRVGDFDESTEETFALQYSQRLRQADHIARIDRLLWEEKLAQAKRMLPRVPKATQLLSKARMALIEGKKTANAEVAQVPAALRHDAGLIYDRMRFRADHGDDKGVREMLLLAPHTLPYPEKWWKPRELQTRKAIDEKNYALASRLMEYHGLTEGSEFADALWLQGWIHLAFHNQPQPALKHFERMYGSVRFPVSKARAAYWAGRAAEAAHDDEAANRWYTNAAVFSTTFYGQLASLKINGTAPLRIPAAHDVSSGEQHAFDDGDIAGAIKLCIRYSKLDLASKLIGGMIENAASDSDAVMIASIGKTLERPYLSVRGAKKAHQQRNLILLKWGYPVPATPYDLAVDRSLALSITRQESEFDPNAKSPAGALGMMQLLPSTAREVARKNDIAFAASKLYEPSYNWTLGSLYLDRLINSYSGSYILAIASYNAGPGNVRKWIAQFGTPGNDPEQAINWIEKIPFSETRNYVQRVLENLQVYRHLESDGSAPKLMLAEDLVR